MSREALKESLSALMDNEANELEFRRVLGALETDDVRGTWSRYQLVRAVMHKELLEPRLDIAASISAALAQEPVINVAPPVGKIALAGRWRGIGRLAVAASVTVAVLAGVRLYNQDEVGGAQLAQQGNQQPLILPKAQTQAQVASYRPTLVQQEAQPQQPLQNKGVPVHIAPLGSVPLQQPAR